MNPIGKTIRRFFNFRDGPEQKASAVSKLLGQGRETAWIGLAAPSWTGRSYEQLVREGYRKNVIANRSVRMVAESAAAVPLVLYRGGERISRHPLLDLLGAPNPLQSGNELIEALFSFLQIAGNAYLEIVDDASGVPGELYMLRPDRMKIVPGSSGWPIRFEYKVGGRTHAFPVDAKSGQSPIVHFRTFHPLDDFYGLSLLEACAFGIEQAIPITATITRVERCTNQTALPPVNVAGALTVVSSNPLTATDNGSSAKISVASHTRHFGHASVVYNSGAITSLSFVTKYYVYCDDPGLKGGAVTYVATTLKTNVADDVNRIYVGEITTPANGGGGSGGGGGGGLLP